LAKINLKMMLLKMENMLKSIKLIKWMDIVSISNKIKIFSIRMGFEYYFYILNMIDLYLNSLIMQ
jgi:hypothetical protein